MEFLHKSNSQFIIREILENRVINGMDVIDGGTPIYGTIFKIEEL